MSDVSWKGNACLLSRFYTRGMAHNHLKAWREFRGMTQEQLADRLDTAKAVISLLENGKRALSDKWLRRIAEVLETKPGHLLDLDPNDVDTDILETWAKIEVGDRAMAVKVLKGFVKTGTDGA